MAAVEEAGVPVAAVCRGALGEAVERATEARRTAAALRDPSTPPATFRSVTEAFRTHMRPGLVAAMQVAASSPEGQSLTTVSSLDLLRGILSQRDSLAVGLLVAEGVDVVALYMATRSRTSTEVGVSIAGQSKVLFERLSMPARFACATALEIIVDLGHNYVGCEHLLAGLAVSRGQAGDLLSEYGVKPSRDREPTGVATADEAVVPASTESADRGRDDVARVAWLLDSMERQLVNLDGTP
jgi:ATP-dependent Clp protease ATP-binding subunit ClpC